jgi:hypothetical protein
VEEQSRIATLDRAKPIKWRYRRIGSVVLSPDFLISLPIGALLGFVVGQVDAIGDAAPTVLLAFLGTLIALATVVIAAHALLVTLMTNEYLAVVERASGGVSAVSRPYKIVASVCATGALVALTATLIWPILPDGYSTTRGLVFGVATFLTSWGLLGATQLIGLGAFHLEQRASLLSILRDIRQPSEEKRRGVR